MRIKLKGKNIITSYKHSIMKLDFSHIKDVDCQNTKLMPINLDNIELIKDGPFDYAYTRKLLIEQPDKVDGWLLYDLSITDPVASLWVMYKGGNSKHYRVRDADSFLFRVFTFDKYKGKGYCGKLLYLVCKELEKRRYKNTFLAVMETNTSAVRAYLKFGFERVTETKFVRFLHYDIPYHKV